MPGSPPAVSGGPRVFRHAHPDRRRRPAARQEFTQALRGRICHDSVTEGAAADAASNAQQFDLLVLTLACRASTDSRYFRGCAKRGAALPVLILTALDAVENRVRGLDLGPTTIWSNRVLLSEFEARGASLGAAGARKPGRSSVTGALEFDAGAKSVPPSGAPLSCLHGRSHCWRFFFRAPAAW